ncbi:hypothetical protein [Magnetofaba australis]|uniref:Uncharacterized protein n=1 Tax=Magnetofaba australis IT-1 TaxID=1434232 RepID=A0A1Y2K311_9PROT|nr:hypothetical protein [Magnetofaba australis]OSM02342.1 hypothetical protein MAIT1_02469 [Magnetofaba australis IT-1]
MPNSPKHLFKRSILIPIASVAILGLTLGGILTMGDIIAEDAALGPVKAAGWVLGPVFLVLGLVYWLSHVKKCPNCGKILWWKKQQTHK